MWSAIKIVLNFGGKIIERKGNKQFQTRRDHRRRRRHRHRRFLCQRRRRCCGRRRYRHILYSVFMGLFLSHNITSFCSL